MRWITLVCLGFLCVNLGCPSSQENKASTKTQPTVRLLILSPQKFSEGDNLYLSHSENQILVKGKIEGKGTIFLPKSPKGVTLQQDGKNSTFEITWTLQDGRNELFLQVESFSQKLVAYRYSQEVENKIALLKKGLKEKIKLPPWEYEIEKNWIIEPEGSLELESGTLVKLGPGAGMDVYGTLMAKGTEENPIQFKRASSDKPWRNITLGGENANNSQLIHCIISGGSGAYFLGLYQGRFAPEEGLVKNGWTIGGGLLIIDADILLQNCNILGNQSWNGGGIYLYRSSSRIMASSIHSNRSQNWGGGVFVMKGKTHLEGNHFGSNQAYGRGGGLALVAANSQVLVNTFSQNTANDSGGGIFIQEGKPYLGKNQVSSNKADIYGGGMALFATEAELADNQISANLAPMGGGLLLRQGSPVLRNNTFSQNQSTSGGGCMLSQSKSTFWKNAFLSNIASQMGGAVYSVEDACNFAQNRFSQNQAKLYGGAFFFRNFAGGSLVENEIFDNIAVKGGGSFGFTTGMPIQESNTRKGNSSPDVYKIVLKNLAKDEKNGS